MVWDVLLVASDLYLQSDEKLLPPTSGFRILGCDMSLADVLSRVKVLDMDNGTGLDNVD